MKTMLIILSLLIVGFFTLQNTMTDLLTFIMIVI
jgi:hypothetical protein